MAREFTKKELSKQQKARALRVDHTYYAKPHPWRTRMKLLSVALPLVALAGLGAFALIPSGASIYMPGPVSTKHGIFAQRCEECHEAIKDAATGKMTFGQVTDAKCTACHDGPVHHENQVYPTHKSLATVNGKETEVPGPGCFTCHAEHATNVRLTEIADRHCTQCHSELKVTSGNPAFASGIKHFNEGHPEFKAKQKDHPDTAAIRFGHETHMGVASSVKKDGKPLVCVDCHRPDGQRAYMAPVNYDRSCRGCHDIALPPNANIGDVKLPHDAPDIVYAKLKVSFSDFLLKSGGKLPGKKEPNPKYVAPKPGRPKGKEPEFIETPDTRSPDEWLKENVNGALKPLFFPEKGKETAACAYCHTAKGKDDATGLPVFEKTNIPQVWFGHARFNHESHRVVECLSCHTETLTSKSTADVLLPGIENCRTCHNPGGARSGCNECHFFHDKLGPKVEGMLSIEELSKGTQKKPAAPAAPATATGTGTGTGTAAAPATDAAAPAAPAPAAPAAPAPAAPAPEAPKEAPKDPPKDAK